ncbi:MAG: hypothetical protein WDO14_14025 [Bacteroidota bacterium]
MTTQDIGFYFLYGILQLFLIYVFIMIEWPHLIAGKKSKKKRKHRARAF